MTPISAADEVVAEVVAVALQPRCGCDADAGEYLYEGRVWSLEVEDDGSTIDKVVSAKKGEGDKL